ncbi:MAG: hypothetical protein KGL39_53820, partial [Patescibacteria group bacterium]|nr:hypothetical protein [Patescibacteria group bacterium]
LIPCRLATSPTGSRSASRRIDTIFSSLNRLFLTTPSLSAGAIISSFSWSENPGACHWSTLLAPRRPRRLRIGLVWKGDATHENDHARSIPHLSVLEPLLRLDATFHFDLQQKIDGSFDQTQTAVGGCAIEFILQKI